MDGARAFDYTSLSAKRMLNLDSEALGVVTAGCAGGFRSDLTLSCVTEPLHTDAIECRLTGLAGGHSGECIGCGRANANKLMGRLLSVLLKAEPETRLITLTGGSKDNAIPREAVARLAVPDIAAARAVLKAEEARIAAELSQEDAGFALTVTPCEGSETLSGDVTRSAVTILTCAANGVLEMSRRVPGLVEFSRNLGVIRQEPGGLVFVFSTRSAIEGQLDASARELDLLAAATGATVRHHSRYPGWDYAKDSEIRDAYLDAYQRVTGREACVNVIHAGLECGIIHAHLPEMDMISIGPDMQNIHSPDEALDLDSVEQFWRILACVITEMQ